MFGSGLSYAWPEVSAASVSKSLCLHAQRAAQSLKCKTPSRSSISRAVDSFASDYPNLIFETPEPTFERFMDEVLSLDWDSSPGYPLLRQGPTYKDLFRVGSDGVPDFDRVMDVWQQVKYRLEELRFNPVLDPVNVFPKGEPLTREKVDAGRVRLIFGISFVDNVISMMLFRPWFEKALEFDKVPFKFGWSPAQGGYRWLSRQLPKYTSFADKSSWDWTVRDWEVELLVRYYRKVCLNWNPVAENNLRAVFGPQKLMLSDKVSVDKLTVGVMPSGTFFTIGGNSLLQVLVHRIACLEIGKIYSDPMSIGDDTLQEEITDNDYWDEWRSYGHIIKYVGHSRDHAGMSEFAGHWISFHNCAPSYTDKHAFRLQHLDPRLVHVEEIISGYARLYALDGVRSRILLKRLIGTPHAVLHEDLRRWYTGLE